MRRASGGVTAPGGFLASGVAAGIKRSGRPDMALVASESPATAAAVFTTNRVKAAPVLLDERLIRSGRARAVVFNSGCANCLTGTQGYTDAVRVGRAAARALGVPAREVLVASTGVIGHRLPVPLMLRAMPKLAGGLNRAGHRQAAIAIQTTDCTVKEAAVTERIHGRRVSVGGMAKGAGMIAPEMATMLAILTTDAAVERALLAHVLREAVGASFNRISVDGDMSTNDTVFALANGRSGARIARGSGAATQLSAMLREVAQRLARAIIEDGEGATRVARIQVGAARTDAEALACARQVANSLLVRTMLAGADPNFGRIAAAVGASSARFDPARLRVLMNGRVVVDRGAACRISPAVAKALCAPHDVTIRIELRAGRGAAEMLTCDLTEEYVRINAGYAT